MRKTDKKIEKKLRDALTEVCEVTLKDIVGYEWITHKVNYQQFPASLHIECAFSSSQVVEQLKHSQEDLRLQNIIAEKLSSVGINLQNVNKQIKMVVK
ncbi:Fis family transcriptional regulator [Psychromonas sp. RZ22]|uniref:Fis family transcriptional regulator n=1 Tax=Psychromonas algarum TaxID=2555643 RepID=UPI0010673593|nr:Fis family transcriptional regulator [Psychromonas sp. RZ22]TEW54634.1 Fis family transcriptional regulator [Psychromonas sp. RZ22]